MESKAEEDARSHEVSREVAQELLDTRRRTSFRAHSALEQSASDEEKAKHRNFQSKRAQSPPTKSARPVLQPLPSLGSAAAMQLASKAENLLDRKKPELEKTEAVQESLKSRLDLSEVERRAAHMREQQKAIIASKKKERDAKLALEESRKGRDKDSKVGNGSSPIGHEDEAESKWGAQEAKSGGSELERRRAAMSLALASRFKEELSEVAATPSKQQGQQLQANQISDLTKKLKQVEQSRQRNEQRDRSLNAYLTRQNAL